MKWLIILLVIGGGAYAGYTRWRSPGSAAVEFQTATASKGDILQMVTANGSLTPVRMVEVGSQISGVITDIRVDFNSTVTNGQVVAQIDPASYERALGEADAQLANAMAALELAQIEFDRAQELLANNLISKADFDTKRVSLSQAKAAVKTREANVERARVDLNRTTITAPMDGIVISRKVEIGQTVAASMNAPTLLVIANDLSRMRIEAAVSEADIGGVEEGQPVQFNVDAFPGRQFTGRVLQVRYAPTTNQSVISYTTVVTVDNKDLRLRPGMTANASFITAERRGVMRIPNAALRFRPPAGAVVRGDTNSPAGASPAPAAVALIESGPFAGLPVMPWQTGGERRRPTEEERAAYVASLTPEQQTKYEKAMAEMRARFAQGGGPGGPGGGGGFGGGSGGGGGGGEGSTRRAAAEAQPQGPRPATIYLVAKETPPMGGETTVLRPVTVKVGISDSTHVEVLEGLKEGDVVATGILAKATTTPSTRPNPLGSPFGGPRPR